MKLTKQQLKQIIKEELEGDEALLDALSMLSSKIEDLDVSIDFLAASLTGGDPHHIGRSQAHLGRGARPQPGGVLVRKEQLNQFVKKELQKILSERGFGEGKPAKDKFSKKRVVHLDEDEEDIEEGKKKKKRREKNLQSQKRKKKKDWPKA